MIRKFEHISYFLRMYKLYRETHGYSKTKAWRRANELLSVHSRYR